MKTSRKLATIQLAALLAAAPAALAQQINAHLAYLFPAGGRQGTTFQVKVGGQFLANANGVWISGSGLQAKVGDYSRPMNGMQATQLRERMQELQKKPDDPATQKELADIRMKLFDFLRRRDINPVLAENITLEIAIAPDAEPGRRELRVRTAQGLSNPLAFCVGQLPEITETEPVAIGTIPGTKQPQFSEASTEMAITLPATINGRIKPGWSTSPAQGKPGQQFTPGDADRYRFQARKGQQLVAAVSARDLIPYLADAVPGWFQATLTLYSAQGKELAYDDDYRFNPDPVVHYQIPADGEYVIEIKDAIYRGREDFIYRITLGEVPFIAGIFPLGGPAGSKTTVALQGWNLPSNQVSEDAADKAPGIYPVSVRKENQLSNSMPFAVDTLPESLEKEPNNDLKHALRVSAPTIINGRIDQPGDQDLFLIEGRAGEQIVAEVVARRLNSPLDSLLALTDAAGRQLAANDDHEDKASGLNTHHADSWLSATLPADGAYTLSLGDSQRKGGPDYAYRLRISPPRPDFELRVVPSSISARSGATVAITVYALRKDGFSGEVALSLKGAPEGFFLSGAWVPAGQEQVRLTLTAAPTPLQEPLKLQLEGRASIDGRDVIRPAAPAEDMMQAFFYRHLVPATELMMAVGGRGGLRPLRVLGESPVRIPAGGTARVRLGTPFPARAGAAQFQLELSEPPEGITLQGFAPSPEGIEIALQCDQAKAKTGLQGNLILLAFAPPNPEAAKGKANQRRVPVAMLPAIPFQIVSP